MSTTLAIPRMSAATHGNIRDPFLFSRMRTWWLMLGLLLLVDQNSIFTVASRQGESLTSLNKFYSVSTPLRSLATALLWMIVIGLMVDRMGPTLRLLLKQKYILSFAILAFLSMLWSRDPQLTFRRGIWLLLSMAFAWLFASSYSPPDQMRLLLVAGVIIALCSSAMAIMLPKYGLDSGGQWKGVYGQKNQFGHAILFLFSGLPFLQIRDRHQLRRLVLQATLALGSIFMSQSKGSLVLAMLLVAVRWYGPFIKGKRRDQRPFVLFSTVFLVIGSVFGRGIFFLWLGRDSTLTGRTHEWAVLIYFAIRHLWLGYGYAAFWTGTGDSVSAMKLVGGAMRGADSGYLDTLLQLGLAGMALWIVAALITTKDFIRLFRKDCTPLSAYWYIGIILATFVGSFTEGFFPLAASTSFIFVVACAGLKNLGSTNVHNGAL